VASIIPTQREEQNLAGDKETIRALVQLAAGVELFTIPLYMTALYSIAGREVKPDGFVYPFMGPTEKYVLQGAPSQRAYNAVYSVYVQEMLHLQLALNIGNVLGVEAALTQPEYPPNPNDGNWIPCLGQLAKLNPKNYPEFAEINVVLGPLDQNAVNLFMAIELPDEDSCVSPPTVPLVCPPEEIATLTFGGIGNLYHVIEQYMAFYYPSHGNRSLFHLCYEDALDAARKGGRSIVQINQFTNSSAYSHMTLQVTSGASPALAAGQVKDMISGIISEGEGSKRSNFNFVSPNYRPDSSDIAADVLWDTYSHWTRFEFVKSILDQVETWPRWRQARQGNSPGEATWQWQDLVANPAAATPAQKALAEARAQAWNDKTTGAELNTILNATFDRFLATLNKLWRGESDSVFPMAAMKSISSRVSSVWAAGAIPAFKKPDHKPTSDGLHACQGLNPRAENGQAPGTCQCATAIQHTCAGTNACAHQGGCGYPVVYDGEYAKQGAAENFIPGQNTAPGNGGCGAPIPVAQVFTEQFAANEFGSLNGSSVWDYARELFYRKNPGVVRKELKPSNIRVILPPS
jgi:hypothetical protein